MSYLQADPDELDRYANSLREIATSITSEAKRARSGVSGLSRFRGKERDRLEQDVAEASRGIERSAKVLEQHAQSLRTFSARIRALRR